MGTSGRAHFACLLCRAGSSLSPPRPRGDEECTATALRLRRSIQKLSRSKGCDCRCRVDHHLPARVAALGVCATVFPTRRFSNPSRGTVSGNYRPKRDRPGCCYAASVCIVRVRWHVKRLASADNNDICNGHQTISHPLPHVSYWPNPLSQKSGAENSPSSNYAWDQFPCLRGTGRMRWATSMALPFRRLQHGQRKALLA